MSVEFWMKAELFYEFYLFLVGLFLLTNIIVLIFIVSYTRKNWRKKLIFSVISLSLIIGGFGTFQYLKYQPYLEQVRYSNPLVRDRQPRLWVYQYYGNAQQREYDQLNYLESLRKMDLYEEEQIIESVQYLGKEGYFHYFKRTNGLAFKKYQQVEFIETTQQAQLIGSKFTLKDERFKEIGFKNPENTMFEIIEIPRSEEGKTYQPADASKIPTAEKSIEWWNF